jgi:hypothetical protein
MLSGALMAVVLAAATLCLQAGLRTQRWIDPRVDALQGARVALALISSDLRAAAPLAPDNEWVGLNRETGGRRFDQLHLGTLNHTPRQPGHGNFCQVGYFIEPDPETGVPTLWRRRHPGLSLKPFEGGTREALVGGVRRFELAYYDGFEWFDTWGDPRERARAATSNRTAYNVTGMPRAVRIRLWLHPGRPSSPPAIQTPIPAASDPSTDNTSSGAIAPNDPEEDPPLRFQTVVQIMVPQTWETPASTEANPGSNPNFQEGGG